MTLNAVIQFKGELYTVCKNKIFKYENTGGGNWKTVHVIFNDTQDRQMSLKITLGSPPVLVVSGAGRDVWSKDGTIWIDEGIKNACVCSVKTLMQAGCKCGGA